MRYLVPALLAAGIALAGCSSADSGGGSSDGTHEGWIDDDLDAAMALAEESGKHMLIDLYADWCGPCRTLSEEYFPSDELEPLLSGLVLVRIDIDTPSGGDLANRYGVSSIPTVIIAEADGTEISRIVGTTPTVSGYADALQEILDSL
jgi:thiol:disulfide interchange protein